jgi:Ca-activated chloride channel family protein
MSWLPGFFFPAAAWLFFLLIPLIAFYFLKLKRPRITIPSLMLWQQVLNDQRVNSPFQRFKRNLLLLFQILLLLFLVLAAMQPFFSGDSDRATRIPVLIDTSASMAALDEPRGKSRLDVAKERIGAIIDNLLPDQKMCLLTASHTARQETVFTGNKRLLKEGLAKISVSDVPGTLEDGIRMAQAVRRGEPFDELVFFSDGNFPQQALLDLPFEIDFRKIDAGGANIGITASTARRADSQYWDVFVELRGNASDTSTATLTIAAGEGADEIVLASKIVGVKEESPQRYVFRIDGRTAAGLLHISVEPEGFDSLEADNIAFLRLEQSRPLQVYAPTNLYAVRHALRTIPDIVLSPEEGTEAPSGQPTTNFDLVISHRADDARIPAAFTCLFGIIPESVAGLINSQEETSEIIDWQRDSPLLEHMNLREVILVDRPEYAAEADSVALAERGFRVLIDGERGPLAIESEDSGSRSVHFLFNPDRSTLPYRVAFPIFVNNVVNEALKVAGLAESKAHPTGLLETLTTAPGSRSEIVGPDGARSSLTADENGLLTGVIARKSGAYRVSLADGSQHVLGASLVSPLETSLHSVPEIRFNEFSVAANESEGSADRPLWRYLAIAALALLFIEWWYFQKRPYPASATIPVRGRKLKTAR